MKTKIQILIGIMIMMPVLAFSQARVTNNGNEKVGFSSIDATKSTVIAAGSTVFISWLPQNGAVTYKLTTYNGNQPGSTQEFTGTVADGHLFVGQGSTGNVSRRQAVSQPAVSNKTASTPIGTTAADNSDFWAKTTLILTNLSDWRINILGQPFEGAALKSKQTSQKSVTLKTGEYVFPVYYDSEKDSTSTGRQYKWAVVDKIVVEGQDTFKIRNEDLQEMAIGAVIKRSLRNNLPIDFLIMAGPNRGKVIAAKTSSDKLTLNVGWNVIPVQYKDDNGLPVQAVLLLMVSETARLSAGEKSGKEVTIERNNIIVNTR
jgi:hypothetical protein